MCGIFCSFDKTRFKELALANSYRGNHSFSITAFMLKNLAHNDEDIQPVFTHKALGHFDHSIVDKLPDGCFMVGHVQAPTTQSRGIDAIHPATLNDAMLWHNGIIKSDEIKRLQLVLGVADDWDTSLLIHQLETDCFEGLSDVDGGFACIYYADNQLYAFTNEICSLYVDDKTNISSAKASPDMKLLNTGMFFNIDLLSRKIIRVPGTEFKTKNSPYYFGD